MTDIRKQIIEACAKVCDDWNAAAVRALDPDKIAPLPSSEATVEPVWMQSDHLGILLSKKTGSDSMLARCSSRQLHPDYRPLYTVPPDQSARIAELEADMNAAKQVIEDIVTSEVEPALARAEKAEAELAEARKDAARYRWLRAQRWLSVHVEGIQLPVSWKLNGFKEYERQSVQIDRFIDSHIDAELAKEPKP